MEDSNEEFEPLFDYTRIQPVGVICLDDDADDTPVFCPKKQKIADAPEEKKDHDVNVKAVAVIDCDDKEDEEEDWLPPPPKNLDNGSKTIEEDSTLKALRTEVFLLAHSCIVRDIKGKHEHFCCFLCFQALVLFSTQIWLKKQELASFAQSAEEVVRAVEESVRKDLNAALQSSPETVTKRPLEPPHERAKLVISIQDKDGLKQFRVFMDDKFERLFKMYADRTKLDVKNLVFCFDGDKISPAETPDSLGMEENDIIEVHVKSS